jgi:serine/threonine protein kinase
MPDRSADALDASLRRALPASSLDRLLYRIAGADPQDVIDENDRRRLRSVAGGLMFVYLNAFAGTFAFIHGLNGASPAVSIVVSAVAGAIVAKMIVGIDLDILTTIGARLDAVAPLDVDDRDDQGIVQRALHPVKRLGAGKVILRIAVSVVMAVVVFQSLDLVLFARQVKSTQAGQRTAAIAATTAPGSAVDDLEQQAAALRKPESNAATSIATWKTNVQNADDALEAARGKSDVRYAKHERDRARAALSRAYDRAGALRVSRTKQAARLHRQAVALAKSEQEAIERDTGGLSDHRALYSYLGKHLGAAVSAALISVVLILFDLRVLWLKLTGLGSLYERRRALRQIDACEHDAFAAIRVSSGRQSALDLRRQVLRRVLETLPMRVTDAVRRAIADGTFGATINAALEEALADLHDGRPRPAAEKPRPATPPTGPKPSDVPDPGANDPGPPQDRPEPWQPGRNGGAVKIQLAPGVVLQGATRTFRLSGEKNDVGTRSRLWLGQMYDRESGSTITVLIKFPPNPDRLDAGARRHRERALREIAISAKLPKHPNIVDVVDVSPYEHADPWFAMEYAEAGSLERWIAGHTTGTLREALAILAQVAAALSGAWTRNIVHLDPHGGNVFVGDALAAVGGVAPFHVPVVKVGDWGSARVVGLADAVLDLRPEGRFPFAPPQAWRRPRDISPCDDLHPLGVLAWQLLTGALPPHLAALGHRPDPDAMQAAIDRRLSTPRPEDDIRAWVRGLPIATGVRLDALLTRLLAADRAAGWGVNPFERLERELLELIEELGIHVAGGSPEVRVDRSGRSEPATTTTAATEPEQDDEDGGGALIRL